MSKIWIPLDRRRALNQLAFQMISEQLKHCRSHMEATLNLQLSKRQSHKLKAGVLVATFDSRSTLYNQFILLRFARIALNF